MRHRLTDRLRDKLDIERRERIEAFQAKCPHKKSKYYREYNICCRCDFALNGFQVALEKQEWDNRFMESLKELREILK